MSYYSAVITGLIIFTVVISAVVIYVFAQPTDLPKHKEKRRSLIVLLSASLQGLRVISAVRLESGY